MPLPAPAAAWTPDRIRRPDGEPPRLAQADGRRYLLLDPGRHLVLLEGPAPGEALELGRPAYRVTASLQGWRLLGLGPGGRVQAALVLEPATRAGDLSRYTQDIPAFVTLERRLALGREWRVHNRLQRLSAADRTLVLELPLLPGERPLGEQPVIDGKIRLTLPAGRTTATWQSRLDLTDELTLSAGPGQQRQEIWRLDADPIWHVGFQGAEPDYTGPAQRPLPTWRPGPGEVLTLAVQRLDAAPGRHHTIDHAQLALEPGRDLSRQTLTLDLRASQGGALRLPLPQDTRVDGLSRNGRPLGAPQPAGGTLSLPLVPGPQTVTLTLERPGGMDTLSETPALALGPGVNAELRLAVPGDRWVLVTGGPTWGPAVLFWGVLAVLAVLAAALGRWRLTPLGTLSWLLLAVGLTQASGPQIILVAGWLLALGWRARQDPQALGPAWRFDALQLGLVLLTVAALASLAGAIYQGLLGHPSMQIAGNGSSANLLIWQQDRFDAALPQAWVLSVPMWVYRVLMLAWALWLAFALLGWLRWGWQAFSQGGLWRSPIRPRPKASAQPPAPADNVEATPAPTAGAAANPHIALPQGRGPQE